MAGLMKMRDMVMRAMATREVMVMVMVEQVMATREGTVTMRAMITTRAALAPTGAKEAPIAVRTLMVQVMRQPATDTVTEPSTVCILVKLAYHTMYLMGVRSPSCWRRGPNVNGSHRSELAKQ
mmetsp:Transcript_19162/g.41301  ORF Transcript_19162/g.41301 Transcript_19162/m.41301 type:complete len:123 (+) Transcript_19162:865-1233(+)